VLTFDRLYVDVSLLARAAEPRMKGVIDAPARLGERTRYRVE
jgi:hypothetical protein